MTDQKVLSRQEVLELLSAKAREGSTSAMIALERALRARDQEQAEAGSLDAYLERANTKAREAALA